MAACNEAQQMLEATVGPDAVGQVPWVGIEHELFLGTSCDVCKGVGSGAISLLL